MASNFPPNPYGDSSGGPAPFNPYGSPQFGGKPFEPHALVQAVKGKVVPPGIFLLVVGTLGLLVSIYNVWFAVFMDPNAMIDPNAPQFLQDMQKQATSTLTLVIQCVFVVVNLVIIGGAIQMVRIKMRPVAFVAAIVAMLNFGTFCCLLGLPAGIWSLIILCQPDVGKAFEVNSQ